MSNTRLEVVKGAYVFRDDTHQKRYVDAVGANVVKYINDFVSVSAVADWTVTVVDGGTDGAAVFSVGNGSGGFLRVATNDAENDGSNAQLGSEAFELTSDQVFYFGAFGVSINDVTQSDLFLGLATTDTDILGGVTDRIGFETLDGAATLGFLVEKNSTETKQSSIATLVDSTAVDLEFFYDGGTGELMVFVNGAEVTAPATTNLPNDLSLRLSLHFLTGEAAVQTLLIDKLVCIQIGR